MHLPGRIFARIAPMGMILFAVLATSPAAQAVSARFAAIYWTQPAIVQAQPQIPELYFRRGETFLQLRPRLAQLGPAMRYNGPSRMELYRRVVGPEGEWQYLPVTSVQLPEHSTAFVLFLSAASQSGQAAAPDAGGYHAAAIDIGAGTIPNGSIGLINLTDTQLAADMRGDRQALEPLQMKVFNPRGEGTDHSLPLKMAIFENEWKPAYSTVLSVLPDQPYLMVFYKSDANHDTYRLRTFRDIYRLRNMVSAVTAGDRGGMKIE